jgi:hypothetical protein
MRQAGVGQQLLDQREQRGRGLGAAHAVVREQRVAVQHGR